MLQAINTELLIIGGSDAGISAALRARELNKNIKITMILADAYPNFSICGLPYALSGEVPDWHNLSHRTMADLEAYDIDFWMNTLATEIKPDAHELIVKKDGLTYHFHYQKLMVGTGARPKKLPSDEGFKNLHYLHTMADYFSLEQQIIQGKLKKIAVVGAGYVGLEVAEALSKRKITTHIYQRGECILKTIDADLAEPIQKIYESNGVQVHLGEEFFAKDLAETFDFVLVAIGVIPNSELLLRAGAEAGLGYTVKVNDQMQTTLTDIYAAGDLVETDHRLLGKVYQPLGTTSHKQGRVAGANMLEQTVKFEGIIGTQVLRAFDKIIARTGLNKAELAHTDFKPVSITIEVDDHKAYMPNSKKMTIRLTADEKSHQILGAQIIGAYGTEVAKRVDIYASAIYNHMTVEQFSNLDLAYSPVVGAPWDAVQQAAQVLEEKLLIRSEKGIYSNND